jgi:hypothetical protein
MPLILGTNSIKDTGYDVANSLRFNNDDSHYLTRTNSSTGSTSKSTISLWMKRGTLGTYQDIFESFNDNSNYFRFRFRDDDRMDLQSDISNSTVFLKRTTRVFRDPAAWLHICVKIDLSQSNADKIKLFINGTRETAFDSSTDLTSTSQQFVGAGGGFDFTIGRHPSDDAYFDGYMAEYVFIDGQALDPTSFGEYNEDSPTIWQPIDVSGLTFGTNGFHLDFESSGSLGNDVSGNSSNFTPNNFSATDQSTDTCTNNGCTWNILYRNQATFSQGNLVYQAPSSNPVFGSISTFGVSAGKWYAECKYVAGSNHYGIIGICDEVFATLNDLGSSSSTDFGKTGSALGSDPNDNTVAYVINTGKIRNNNNNQNYGSGGGDGDIINIALDRTNRKVYFGINGTYENSGNPSSGSNGFDLSSQVTGDLYFLGVTNDTGASETILDFNFGAGFGQTTVSSGNSDANGFGNFEHAVPTGFFSWNSKNLAENG